MPVRPALILASVLFLTRLAVADDAPLAIADVKGKTGAIQFVAAEHDTRSVSLADVAKRMGLKPADAAAAAYELAQQPFVAYVPKTAADDGKFGLMVGLCPAGVCDPPKAWVDVLERHHLIWLAAAITADGDSPIRRVGLLLDAVHAARKGWNVDTDRVYLFADTAAIAPEAGAALYYPEVFAGAIASPQPVWFAKVKGFEKPPVTYDTDVLPKPQASDLSRAKVHGRFFLVAADKAEAPTDAAKADPLAANGDLQRIVRHGYQAIGFKFVQGLVVPAKSVEGYTGYPADWFEQGITFLDAGGAALRQKPVTVGNTAPTRTTPSRTPSPVGPIRLPAGGAGNVPSPGGFGF